MWWQALGLAQGFLAWLRGVGLVEWISLWAVVGLTVYCIVLGSLSATWACIQVNLKVFLGWMNYCMVLSLINHKRRMREMCLSVWGVQYLILSNSSMVCGRARGWVGGWVCVCVCRWKTCKSLQQNCGPLWRYGPRSTTPTFKWAGDWLIL